VPPGRHREAVAQIVDSVGPYKLKNWRPPAQRSTRSCGQGSPATVITRRAGRSACGSAISADGGSVTIEMRSSLSVRRSGTPGSSASGAAT
jgi:hypothetical protein